MRIKQLKLEAALLLVAAMVFSTPASMGMLTASAATGTQVRLNVKTKTLKTGQKGHKLKLVNNKQNWKIQKVTSTKASVCKPYGKKKTYVLLKGQKKGTATIRVKIVRTVKKNGKKTAKSKWLSCKVSVKQKAPDTQVPDATGNGDMTVSSQAQLEKALQNSATKTLLLKTDAADTFTIPKADYKEIGLTVDAPNADVVNNGTFKSISVLAIKDSTWFENAVGNILNVLAKASRIVVRPNANVGGISFAAPDANAKVSVAQGGSVKNVSIAEGAQRTKVDMDVNGSVENMQLAAPDANVKLDVAKGGTVNGVSMTTQAKSTKVDLTVDGQVGNVSFAAPDADIKVAVAEGGAVSKVSMDAAADNAKVGLDVKGAVSEVSLDAQKADVSLAVNDNGKVDSVTISKEMDVSVSGTAKTALAVKVSAAAKITASTGITLESSANVSILLEKGAEGSSIKIVGNMTAIGVKVENKTGKDVAVNTPNGNFTVSEGSNRDITVNAPTSSGGSSSGGSSSGSSSSGGSSSGGSSSGGSSSGGSSSGGSGSTGDQTAPPTGIMMDHTDFTMKLGEEGTISVSTNPKGAGQLKNISWDGGYDIVSISSDWETVDTLKVKAEKVGTTVISVSANVYGPEKDSALILPNQTKTIIVTVTEDGSTPEPAAKLKLTPESSSININESTKITAEIESPKGAEISSTIWRYFGDAINAPAGGSNTSFDITGRLKGKGTVTAISTVTLPDGTSTDVAATVEIEVTDKDAPDPENVSPYFWLNSHSVMPVEVGKKCDLSVLYDSRYYGLEVTKVEWTSSDESVLRIDEKRHTHINFTSLKAGRSDLTADITFSTGAKTFTKKLTKTIIVRNLPEIVCSVNVVSGSTLSFDMAFKIGITASEDGANVPVKSIEDAGVWAVDLSADANIRDLFNLTKPEKMVYENVPIWINLESGEKLSAKLKITRTKDNTGKDSAAAECTKLEWTFNSDI